MEFRQHFFPLGRVDVAINSAKDDAFIVEELAHKVQTPPPEGEDYTGNAVSSRRAVVSRLACLLI